LIVKLSQALKLGVVRVVFFEHVLLDEVALLIPRLLAEGDPLFTDDFPKIRATPQIFLSAFEPIASGAAGVPDCWSAAEMADWPNDEASSIACSAAAPAQSKS
jgi:hypothetical protein